jgi:hypothetical protein
MVRITNRAVRRANGRAANLLKRNADPVETFEGVLNRQDTHALGILIALGERFLAGRRRARRARARTTRYRVVPEAGTRVICRG